MVIESDGYYWESLACFIIGVLWLVWKNQKVKDLQSLITAEWTCNSSSSNSRSL